MRLSHEQKLLLRLRKKAIKTGMTQVAEQSGLARETLYRTLSIRGNPCLRTLLALLPALKMRLAVTPRRGRR